MNGQELASYLAEKGFVVKSISTVDAFGNTLKKLQGAHASKTVIRAPFSKGITDTSLPNCQYCKKVFANDLALGNHFRVEHSGQPIPKAEEEGQNDNGKKQFEILTGSQYQVVDSSFNQTGDEDEYKDDTSFIIIRTTPECAFNNSARRARRIETKPRRAYDSRVVSQKEDEMEVSSYQCQHCPKAFATCCLYTQHFHNDHTKAKKAQIRCQICDTKIELEEPLRRNVSCDICLKSFAHRGALEAHMQVHGKVKSQNPKTQHANLEPYPCKLCKRRFRLLGHLNSHLKVHGKYNSKQTDDGDMLDMMYVSEEQLASDVYIIQQTEDDEN